MSGGCWGQRSRTTSVKAASVSDRVNDPRRSPAPPAAPPEVLEEGRLKPLDVLHSFGQGRLLTDVLTSVQMFFSVQTGGSPGEVMLSARALPAPRLTSWCSCPVLPSQVR